MGGLEGFNGYGIVDGVQGAADVFFLKFLEADVNWDSIGVLVDQEAWIVSV